MLTAITIMTIVGGSLAFKAKKEPFTKKCLFRTTNLAAGVQCVFSTITRAITAPDEESTIKALTTQTTTTIVGGPETCTLVAGGGNPNPVNCVTAYIIIEL